MVLPPKLDIQPSTDGSEWIIKCAKQETKQPLWVMGWGGLEDLAQALKDARKFNIIYGQERRI